MKNHYEILELKEEYGFMVMSLNKFNVACNSKEMISVAAEVKKRDLKNEKILLDNLLTSGNTDERFIEIDIDSEGNMLSESLRFVQIDKESPIRKKSTEYLSKMEKLVEYSVLNSGQKILIKNGLTI